MLINEEISLKREMLINLKYEPTEFNHWVVESLNRLLDEIETLSDKPNLVSEFGSYSLSFLIRNSFSNKDTDKDIVDIEEEILSLRKRFLDSAYENQIPLSGYQIEKELISLGHSNIHSLTPSDISYEKYEIPLPPAQDILLNTIFFIDLIPYFLEVRAVIFDPTSLSKFLKDTAIISSQEQADRLNVESSYDIFRLLKDFKSIIISICDLDKITS